MLRDIDFERRFDLGVNRDLRRVAPNQIVDRRSVLELNNRQTLAKLLKSKEFQYLKRLELKESNDEIIKRILDNQKQKKIARARGRGSLRKSREQNIREKMAVERGERREKGEEEVKVRASPQEKIKLNTLENEVRNLQELNRRQDDNFRMQTRQLDFQQQQNQVLRGISTQKEDDFRQQILQQQQNQVQRDAILLQYLGGFNPNARDYQQARQDEDIDIVDLADRGRRPVNDLADDIIAAGRGIRGNTPQPEDPPAAVLAPQSSAETDEEYRERIIYDQRRQQFTDNQRRKAAAAEKRKPKTPTPAQTPARRPPEEADPLLREAEIEEVPEEDEEEVDDKDSDVSSDLEITGPGGVDDDLAVQLGFKAPPAAAPAAEDDKTDLEKFKILQLEEQLADTLSPQSREYLALQVEQDPRAAISRTRKFLNALSPRQRGAAPPPPPPTDLSLELEGGGQLDEDIEEALERSIAKTPEPGDIGQGFLTPTTDPAVKEFVTQTERGFLKGFTPRVRNIAESVLNRKRGQQREVANTPVEILEDPDIARLQQEQQRAEAEALEAIKEADRLERVSLSFQSPRHRLSKQSQEDIDKALNKLSSDPRGQDVRVQGEPVQINPLNAPVENPLFQLSSIRDSPITSPTPRTKEARKLRSQDKDVLITEEKSPSPQSPQSPLSPGTLKDLEKGRPSLNPYLQANLSKADSELIDKASYNIPTDNKIRQQLRRQYRWAWDGAKQTVESEKMLDAYIDAKINDRQSTPAMKQVKKFLDAAPEPTASNFVPSVAVANEPQSESRIEEQTIESVINPVEKFEGFMDDIKVDYETKKGGAARRKTPLSDVNSRYILRNPKELGQPKGDKDKRKEQLGITGDFREYGSGQHIHNIGPGDSSLLVGYYPTEAGLGKTRKIKHYPSKGKVYTLDRSKKGPSQDLSVAKIDKKNIDKGGDLSISTNTQLNQLEQSIKKGDLILELLPEEVSVEDFLDESHPLKNTD